ncbi:MAG: hypothetical protein NWE91_08340 [Candidatus Bathyarchaeota archaeon]|nr:hypothetical protein [Candidatus Bathyarchaeota archaeon]
MRLWADVIAEKMKNNATIEEMEEEISRRDSAVRKVNEYIKIHPIMSRGIILQNIQGFRDYFKYKAKIRQ